MSSGRSSPTLLATVWAFALFAPSFRGYVGTAGAILVNGGLLVIAAVIFAWRGVRIRFVDGAERDAAVWVLGSLVYYLIAVTFSTAFLADEVIFRDAFELHKPMLHAASFLFPLILIQSEDDAKRLQRILNSCFTVILLAAAFQFIAPSAVGRLYTKAINIRAGRVSVPFGNPYDFGFAISLFAYVFLFRFLEGAGRHDLGRLALAMAAIVLTQSRTAVITLGFALTILVPVVLLMRYRGALARLEAPTALIRYGLLVFAAIAASVIVVVKFQTEVAYLVQGIRALLLRGEQSSLNVRIGQLEQTLELADGNLLTALFGNGVSKADMEFLESAYAFFLYRFGMLGLVVIFLLPLAVAGGRLLRITVAHADRLDPLAAGVLVWLGSLFIASVGNNFTEQPRVSFIYYFMLGLAIRWTALVARPREAAAAADARSAWT